MKKLKPTNLIAVEVSEKIKVTQFTNGIFYQEPQPSIDIDYKKLNIKYQKNAKLLGEVTKEGIQFDVKPYLGIHTVSETKYYYNYLPFEGMDFRDVIDNSFNTPQESFQSLLQANNVEIPEGKKLLILLKQ